MFLAHSTRRLFGYGEDIMVCGTCPPPSQRLQEARVTSVGVSLCNVATRPSQNVGCVNEQVHMINCEGQRSTTWTGVFPRGVPWNSLTWITWPLRRGLPRRWAGRASLSLPRGCARTRTQTHTALSPTCPLLACDLSPRTLSPVMMSSRL